MTITAPLFEANLKCPTKCFLRSVGETAMGNVYGDWLQTQKGTSLSEWIKRLLAESAPDECVIGPSSTENLKTAQWRLAVDFVARAENLESSIHAVQRVPPGERGEPAQFIPMRYIFTNKLTTDDKLLLAFDALVLSEMLGREVCLGKIIHGDDHARLKVKTSTLMREVRKLTGKIIALLSSSAPPDLVLNQHCAECEFQARCRQKAMEKDDLSLLASMTEKERKEYRSKGIFTVTQLSYTFRPRRRPKRLRDKREKYHHSLKALAIREGIIHIVGSPELKIEGTPVYLDVEGLPDRDFYYLIGMRIRTGDSVAQHSLWADSADDEKRIWGEFLGTLATVENPVLVHYGSYERTFLKRMRARYGDPPTDATGTGHTLKSSVNLLSTIFAQIYYPTYSNSLKNIAGFLGFNWSEAEASGARSVVWRHIWEAARDPVVKETLVTYNAEDCEALALIAQSILRLAARQAHPENTHTDEAGVVCIDALNPLVNKWRRFSSSLGELEFITNAAHWDYQRDRIYVRSSTRLKRARPRAKTNPKSVWRVDKTIDCEASNRCPRCHRKGMKQGPARPRSKQEILFGRSSLKRRVIQYRYQPYWCSSCRETFGVDEKLLKRGKPAKYGRSLLAYMFYQIIELCIPTRIVAECVRRLFGLVLNTGTHALFKSQLAEYYSNTHQQILKRLVSADLIHVDETHVSIRGKRAYVWVFTNMHEVAYLYSETREGELAYATLGDFKGVLVSDFYAVYDSLDCPQQKCLIHLVRDLNGGLLDHPYDEELKRIIKSFGVLLKGIVEDVDRRGLKKHFLRKHLAPVGRFYRDVIDADYQSAAAVACTQRFAKNRDKLFTFLKFDGIPWNNNNAEHAIKAFAKLRDVIEGSSTEKGIREYLILLSVCQTCKYQGLDFLDFLRSGEKDIDAFAQSGRRGQRSAPSR